jgi:broad specificity phosphatase PhoE
MPVVEPRTPPSGWRLSEKGRLQSGVLAEKLKEYGLGCLVASEEPKATETAEIVGQHLGLSWGVAPGLQEHDRTGAAFGTQNEFESAARTFFENPGSPVWGNETAEQARARFTDAVRAVIEKRPEGNLALVAHGTVITLSHVPRGLARPRPALFLCSIPARLRAAGRGLRRGGLVRCRPPVPSGGSRESVLIQSGSRSCWYYNRCRFFDDLSATWAVVEPERGRVRNHR